jgi:hypothetical protein
MFNNRNHRYDCVYVELSCRNTNKQICAPGALGTESTKCGNATCGRCVSMDTAMGMERNVHFECSFSPWIPKVATTARTTTNTTTTKSNVE